MTAEELLRELVDNYNPQDPEDSEDPENPENPENPEDSEAIEPFTATQLQNWLLDMQQLLAEHYARISHQLLQIN